MDPSFLFGKAELKEHGSYQKYDCNTNKTGQGLQEPFARHTFYKKCPNTHFLKTQNKHPHVWNHPLEGPLLMILPFHENMGIAGTTGVKVI